MLVNPIEWSYFMYDIADVFRGENIMYKLMILSFLIGCLIFLRVVWPIKSKWKWLAAIPLLFASLKFIIIRMIGGPKLFAPEVPGGMILIGGWLFAAMMFFFFVLLVYEAVRVCFFRRKPKEKLRKLDMYCHLGILAVVIVTVSVGVYNTIPTPRISRYTVKIKNLPPQASGIKIAVLSDLHADPLTGKKRIAGMVKRTMEQNADIIAIVGDFVDGSVERTGPSVAPLSGLKAKYGVYGVAGNHEYYSGYPRWKVEFERLGIKMLDNSNVVLDCGIAVAGITDRAAARRKLSRPSFRSALNNIPENTPVIFLSHRPETAELASVKGVDLQFSGHTHGGMAPFLARLVANANGGFVSGLYKVRDTTLIVSNGSGIWNGFPVRLCVPAEIIVVTLR